MKINGREIAQTILSDLTARVQILKNRGVTPTVAVILVGDDRSSLAYIKQKQHAADKIGARLLFNRQSSVVSRQTIFTLINQYNNDPTIHGIVLQRPLPPHLTNDTELLNSIKLEKDIDGFVPQTKFQVPVVMAIEKVLSYIKNDELCTMNHELFVVVIGRGETAGKPIAEYFRNHQCTTSVIHSQTPIEERNALLQQADLIISCVGKSRMVQADTIKPGVILMSVGLWNDAYGKLHGDYEEDEIKNSASYYTPTPGGIGPINIACLMNNLVSATKLLTNLV